MPDQPSPPPSDDAAPDQGETVTVLHAHDGKRLAKTFALATNGQVRRIDFPGATWFRHEAVPVANIDDLAAVLRRLEGDEGACVIRGALAEGADPKRLRRQKVGAGASFVEVPRQWLMLDVDGIPLAAGTSILDDPADAARTLLDLLAAHAPELDGVTAVVQFSSSAGLDEVAAAEAAAGIPARWSGVIKPGVTAHVWLWLEQPIGEFELKRWMAALAAGGLKLDKSTNGTVQPHYVAGPRFRDGLRDPLADGRLVVVRGWSDAALLRIPEAAPRPSYDISVDGRRGPGGRGYGGHLADIGGADGFRQPLMRAACAFVATTWPGGDLTALKADIRARIAAADPGGRSPDVLADYASDRHINGIVQWAREQEGAKRAAQAAEVERPVAPTFPDRGVILPEAERLARKALAGFCRRIEAAERVELLLSMTVGAGKSAAAIAALPDMRAAARSAGRTGAVYMFFPRHDLGAELLARMQAAHPTVAFAIWRGMDRPDPSDPSRTMCRDLELSGAAMRAGAPATAACPACAYMNNGCGYHRQREQPADVVWLMPHNLVFQAKPAGLPDAAVVVVDESFTGTALRGQEAGHPVQLALAALEDDRTGALTGLDRQRLHSLRRLARDALGWQEAGGLLRDPFLRAGFEIPDSAAEWLELEWAAKPRIEISRGMDRTAALAVLEAAAQQGFNPLLPRLAERVRDLLNGTDARSVGATFVTDARLGRNQGSGPAVRFEWREDFAAWIAATPKLFLCATTPAELLRIWAPDLQVADIEARAPGQRVRQVIGAEFGRASFVQNRNNVRRLADLVVVELAATDGEVLVVAQEAVEALLSSELVRRFGTIPPRLHLAHHGNITGMNSWEHVTRVVVVGRPAVNRLAGERLAELLRGSSVSVVVDGDAARWPTVTAGIRMADGTGRAVVQPRHPDALVEAVRWSISEGAVVQGIGRCRGVRRNPAEPVVVTLLAEMALPLTVAEVIQWPDAQPSRLEVAAAEAALTGRALPLAPGDLAQARPDLWSTKWAAEQDLDRANKGGISLIKKILLYKRNTPLSALTLAAYRKAGGRGSLASALVPVIGGRAVLEAIVGPLSAYSPEAQEQPAPADAKPTGDLPEAAPSPPPVDDRRNRDRLHADGSSAAPAHHA